MDNKTLLNEFVKITNDNKTEKKVQLYGTIVTEGNSKYVKIDGSDIKTPFKTTAEINNNERVIVNIDNHMAVVTGNLSDPSASGNRVEDMSGSIGRFDHLFAGNITAENIKANSITTEKLMAGSITADKIATGAITAGSGIIADGAIGNAQINNLDAAKIVSGTIDTSDVTIAGSDGVLRIKDNRVQVFNGMGIDQVERVSMGDVNGDGTVYGLRVRGADGETILIDENGVTEEGITDGSISNDKINPNAGIEGGKLDIDSVVESINKDGSKTINSVRIDVDGMGLGVVVKEIKDKSDEQDTRIRTNTSEISANKASIKMKVDEQTYETDKENMNNQFNKHTTEIGLLKDQMTLKVESTDIENAIDANNKVVDSKIETAKSEIKMTTDSITSRVDHVETNTARNLLMNTNFASDASKVEYWMMWTSAGDGGGWYYTQHGGFPQGEGIGVKCTVANTITEMQTKTIRVTKGETYTVSADVVVEKNLRDAVVVFREFKKDGTWVNVENRPIPTNFEGRGVWTHTIQGDDTNALQILFVNQGPYSNTSSFIVLFINRVQLERGDKATKWHLGQMDSLTGKFAEIKQTTDGITNTVSDVQNGVSQVTQRVDSVEYKFTTINAPNMIPNGNPRRTNTMGWSIGGDNCGFYMHHPGDWAGIWSTNTTWETFAFSPRIRIYNGGRYSLSFFVQKEVNIRSCEVYLIGSNDENMGYDWVHSCTGEIWDNNFHRVKQTVSIPSSVKYLRFRVDNDMNTAGGSSGGYVVWFGEFMFIEGEGIYPDKWYPASNESYNDITSISASGVHVRHDSSGDYTHMSSQGFKRHRSDGSLRGDYHYLFHQGTIFCNSEQLVRIYLPSDFHGKSINAVAAAACIGNGTDAWDKPEPLVSFWAEVNAIASDASWVEFYASTRQNRNGTILTQHKGIKFAYWVTA